MKCTYCDQPAVMIGPMAATDPAMCGKHLDVATAISALQRAGKTVTAGSLRVFLAHTYRLGAFREGEIERMVREMASPPAPPRKQGGEKGRKEKNVQD